MWKNRLQSTQPASFIYFIFVSAFVATSLGQVITWTYRPQLVREVGCLDLTLRPGRNQSVITTLSNIQIYLNTKATDTLWITQAVWQDAISRILIHMPKWISKKPCSIDCSRWPLLQYKDCKNILKIRYTYALVPQNCYVRSKKII